jgi:hypothetical protein
MSQTPEQNLLSKLYESQDEIQSYINSIDEVDINGLHYRTLMALLITKKDLNELISKLETMICDKQELM